MHPMDPRGAACLVTGASSGIGRAMAIRLARAGATVMATGRDAEALGKLARETGGPCFPADLREPTGVDALAAEAGRVLHTVDILVNNAGSGWAGPFIAIDPEEAESLVRLNLLAPIRLTSAFLPGMLRRGRGHVVNVASIAGHVGVRDEAVYAASKAGLIAFTESLRYEVAASGVEVTLVSPAVVATPFFARRGRPYGRSRPRPITPDRVAQATVAAIKRGRPEVFVPGWTGMIARFRGAAPNLFRRLASRYG